MKIQTHNYKKAASFKISITTKCFLLTTYAIAPATNAERLVLLYDLNIIIIYLSVRSYMFRFRFTFTPLIEKSLSLFKISSLAVSLYLLFAAPILKSLN